MLLHNDGHGRFVDVTAAVGLDQNNDRFSFAPAWADYDEDGWPDLLVANDFGRKNLYHNEGVAERTGHASRTWPRPAGVEDYGAGMSAAFVDYDNDGHLDIYTGNMWTAAGQRVTAQPGFMPDAPPEIREIYRRHARGNSLFRNRGDGTFEDVTLDGGRRVRPLGLVLRRLRLRQRRLAGPLRRRTACSRATPTSRPSTSTASSGARWWRSRRSSASPARPTTTAGAPPTGSCVSNGAQAQHERNVLLRNDGEGGFDEVSGTVGLDLDQDGRSFAVFDYDVDGDPDLVLLAARSSPQLRLFRNDFAAGHAAARACA